MAEPVEKCIHPIELRETSMLGDHHYCPRCRSVLTSHGPEPVVIRKVTMR